MFNINHILIAIELIFIVKVRGQQSNDENYQNFYRKYILWGLRIAGLLVIVIILLLIWLAIVYCYHKIDVIRKKRRSAIRENGKDILFAVFLSRNLICKKKFFVKLSYLGAL